MQGTAYLFFGKKYVESQGAMMARVFESLLNAHSEAVPEALRQLSCLTTIDYTRDIEALGSAPLAFVNKRTFYAGEQFLCLATSYGKERKRKLISQLFALCGEDESAFELLGEEEIPEKPTGKRRKTRAADGVSYRLFGKEYHSTQTEMLYLVLEEFFKRAPELADWAADHLNCVSRTDYTREENRQSGMKSPFRSCRMIRAGGGAVCVGGGYSLRYKQNFIDKLRRQAKFPGNVFELHSYRDGILLHTWQSNAIRAALDAVERQAPDGRLGLLLQPEGAGKRRMLEELIFTLASMEGGRPILLFTQTSQLADAYAQSMQARLGAAHVRMAHSQKELEKLIGSAGTVTVSNVQKVLERNRGGKDPFVKTAPFFASTSLLAIVEEASAGYFGRIYDELRQRFPNAAFLALSSDCCPEPRMTERFGPVLYCYTHAQAYEDGLLGSVRYRFVRMDEKDAEASAGNGLCAQEANWIADQERDARNRCSLVLCKDRETLAELCFHLLPRFGPERIKLSSWKQYEPHGKQIALPREIKEWDGKRFYGLVLACVPRPGMSCALDAVYLTGRVDRRRLMTVLSPLARLYPERTEGELIDFCNGWQRIESFMRSEFPIFAADKPENAAPELSGLRKRLAEALSVRDYDRAVETIREIEALAPAEGLRVKEQMAFLFPPSTDSGASAWNRDGNALRAWQSGLWRLLSAESVFGAETLASPEPEEEGTPAEPAPVPAALRETSQARGTRLEQAVQQMIAQLFALSPEDVLKALYTQASGTQFGFDVGFSYRDRSGAEVNCKIECKNYQETQIPTNQIIGKLEQLRRTGQEVDHWILISPNGRVSNELRDMVRSWRENDRWEPIRDVQLWTREERVDELFGLFPELYAAFYQTDEREDPRNWSEAKREKILAAWREKLRPVPHMPTAWKTYLREPRCLLTQQESDKETAARYERIYPCRAAMRLLDEQERPIEGCAEEQVLRWLEKPDSPCALLLGDFGDGKSFFTYTLARLLAERFSASPKSGWIPLRISLRELGDSPMDSRDILAHRLREFQAELSAWNQVNREYRFLLMLDGLDEMSQGMNDTMLLNNLDRLEGLTEQFRGNKLLVTSRKMVLYSDRIRERILEALHQPVVWHLAPLRREDRLAFLERLADTQERRRRLETLRRTHGLMELASKPLFLDMLRVQLDNDDIHALDIAEIYQDYAWRALERKFRYQLARQGDYTSQDELRRRLFRLLEELAVCLQRSGASSISLADFRAQIGREELAQELWSDVEETAEAEEDMDSRLTNRSLLKYDGMCPENRSFCHRSMQEYFVARGICRRLCDPEESEARALLAGCRFSYEIMAFAGLELQRMESVRKQTAVERLCRFAHETADDLRRRALACLGTNCVNLLHAGHFGLPGTDWHGLLLDNAVLSGEHLAGKDFSGSSMRYAHLDNADLTNCDLRRCDFTGVQFEKSGQLLDFAPLPGGESLLACYRDGHVRRWRLADGEARTLGKTEMRNVRLFLRGGGREAVLLPERLQFWLSGADVIEERGYAPLREGLRVLDIGRDAALLARGDCLRLVGLGDGRCRWERTVSCDFDARLMGGRAILLWTEDGGLELVRLSGGAPIPLHCTRKGTASAMYAAMLSETQGVACFGFEPNKVMRFLFYFDGAGGRESFAWHALPLVCGEKLRAAVADNAEEIYAATARGEILHYRLNRLGEFEQVRGYRLELKCAGAKLDGIVPQRQYDMLRRAQR